jgi:hypothetical protein
LVGSISSCGNSKSTEIKTVSYYEKGVINYKENDMYFKVDRDDKNTTINLLVSDSAKLYKHDDSCLGLAYDASNVDLLTEGLKINGYMNFELKGTEMVQFNFKISALKFLE